MVFRKVTILCSGAVLVGLIICSRSFVRGSDSMTATWTPDQLQAAAVFIERVRAVADYHCRTFSKSAWEEIGKLLTNKLQGAKSAAEFKELIATFANKDDRSWLPSEFQITAKAMADLSHGKTPAPNTPGVTVKDGIVHIDLPEELAQLTLVWKSVHPHLAAGLAGLDYTTIRGPGGAAAVQKVVLDALRAYEADQRSVALLQLLGEQDQWLVEAVGAKREQIDVAIKALNHAEGDELASAEAGASEIERAIMTLVTTAEEADVPGRIERALPAVPIAPIDLPHVAGGPFLRIRLSQPPGTMSLTGRYSICVPNTNSTLNGLATVDEIDLGVSVLRIGYDPTQNPPLKLLETGVVSRVELDTPALKAAAGRLGLPPFVDVVNASATFHDFGDIELTNLTVVAPPFASPLFHAFGSPDVSLGSFRMNRDGLQANWGKQIDDKVKQLQRQFEDRFAKPQQLGGALTLVSIKPTTGTDWTVGRVGYVATIRCDDLFVSEGRKTPFPNGLQFTLPVSLDRNSAGQWALEIGAVQVPTVVESALRDTLAEAIQDNLSALDPNGDLAKLAELLNGSITVSDLTLDLDKKVVNGSVSFAYEGKTAAKIAVAAPFAWALDSGKVAVDFSGIRKLVAAELKQIVNDLASRANVQVANGVVAQINGTTATLFGLDFQFNAVMQSGRVVISAHTKVNDTLVSLENIRMRTPTIGTNGLQPGDLDFGGARLKGISIQDVVRQSVPMLADYVMVSQPRFDADGVAGSILLHLDALGVEIPLTDFKVGFGKFAFETSGKFKPMLVEALKKWGADHPLTIGDVGPVEHLKLLVDGGAATFTVRVTGDIEIDFLGETVEVPVSARVFPNFGDVRVEKDELKKRITTIASTVGQALKLGDVKIKNVQPLDAPEPGVSFDLSGKVFEVTMEADNVRVTRMGVSLPQCISGSIGGTYPLGSTGLMLHDPGIRLWLDPHGPGGRAVAATGDVIFDVPGTEHVVRFQSEIKAALPVKSISTESDVVLVEKVKLFRDQGVFDIDAATITQTSEIVGPLRRIIGSSGKQTISAKQAALQQSANLELLGKKVAEAELGFWGLRKKVTADGQAELLGAKANFRFETEPNFTRTTAEVDVKFDVGPFDALNARCTVKPAVAHLKTKVLGVNLGITTPGLQSITPDNILSAIESAFDLDISNLWNLIKNRDIEISLIPSKKGKEGDPEPTLGEGDPIPEADGKASPQSSTNDSNQAAANKQTRDQESKNDNKRTPADGGTDPSGFRPAPEHAEGDEDGQGLVSTYQPGSYGLRFDPDPQRAGLFDAVLIKDGQVVADQDWDLHFPLNKTVVDHLSSSGPTGGAVILYVTWDRLPGQPATQVCCNQVEHDRMPSALTVDHNGNTYVVGLYPEGRVVPVDIDWSKIGNAALTDKSTRMQNLSDPKNRLQTGDLQVLSILSVEALSGKPIQTFERLPAEAFNVDGKPLVTDKASKPLAVDDGYVIVRASDQTMMYISRKGNERVLPSNGRLVTDCDLMQESDLRSKTVMKLLAAVACDAGTVGYVAGSPNGPVALSVDVDDQQLLVIISGDGTTQVVHVDHWEDLPRGSDPVWNEKDPTTAKMLVLLMTGKWDGITVADDATHGRRIAITRGLDRSGPWAAKVLLDADKDTGGPAVLPAGNASYDGQKIEEQWPKWTADGGDLAVPPTADIKSSEGRRWVIAQLISDDPWQNVWLANPRYLLGKMASPDSIN